MIDAPRIREVRQLAGLSQAGMARLLELSERTVERWESGQMACHPLMFRGLLAVLVEAGRLSAEQAEGILRG